MRTFLPAAAALLALASPAAASLLSKRQAVVSLHNLFVRRGKQYFGTITDQRLLLADVNAAIITSNFGQLTNENSLKWESVEPERGVFNFDEPDFVLGFAEEHNIPMRGHTLVWHSQLPGYVQNITDAAELTEVITEHVTTVVERYKGKMFAWVSDYHDP